MKRLGDVAKQLTASDLNELFGDAWWLDVLKQQDPGVPIHFVDNSLAIDGNLTAGAGPWNLIVQGDLHATGNLDFATGDYKVSLLVVLGNVRAKSFFFTNGANCIVAHDLVVSDVVLGRYGDESARLVVSGLLRARAVLLDHVTPVDAETLDAIVCTVEGWGLPIDINYYADNRHIFDARLLDHRDGTLELREAWRAVDNGTPIFLPDVEAQLRAKIGTQPRKLRKS